jgi:hypothetical protein
VNYGLGNYAGQLNIPDDDLNMALRNSGSTYQVGQQQSSVPDVAAAPQIEAVQQPQQPQANEAPGPKAPSVDDVEQPKEEKKNNGMLRTALGIVGSIFGGVGGAVLGATAGSGGQK